MTNRKGRPGGPRGSRQRGGKSTGTKSSVPKSGGGTKTGAPKSGGGTTAGAPGTARAEVTTEDRTRVAGGGNGPEPAIVTTGLTKRYFDQPALDPLDLVVPAGQRITLIGHNGSGKTTFLRMLGGTLEPTDGDATIVGAPIGTEDARADVSFLTDRPVFYDDLTVWEHLEYIARLHGTADWEQHAADLLDAVGLTARADDLPSTFSRGLGQKAAIAMALVRPFEVLLVDEPFVGLDHAGREALLDLLADAHADGATLLVATHELSSAAKSDRVLALRDGALIFDGPPDRADVVALVEGLAEPDADGRRSET